MKPGDNTLSTKGTLSTNGTLFVVATPIGNLNDLSQRGQEVLGSVDLIAAEDTRVTGRLLSHFGIQCRQIALHEHNEAARSAQVVDELQKGLSVALVSDAGTPLISDPGFRLLQAAHNAGVSVSPIPGAAAFVAALSASGLATDRFVFEGFLPAKSAARRERMQQLSTDTRTVVLYESVHRIAATLADAQVVFGAGRAAFIGRELTKLHEQCVSADLETLAKMLSDGDIVSKGEFVVAIAGAPAVDSAAAVELVNVEHLLQSLLQALPGKQAVTIAAAVTGRNKNALYRQMLSLKESVATDVRPGSAASADE